MPKGDLCPPHMHMYTRLSTCTHRRFHMDVNTRLRAESSPVIYLWGKGLRTFHPQQHPVVSPPSLPCLSQLPVMKKGTPGWGSIKTIRQHLGPLQPQQHRDAGKVECSKNKSEPARRPPHTHHETRKSKRWTVANIRNSLTPMESVHWKQGLPSDFSGTGLRV